MRGEVAALAQRTVFLLVTSSGALEDVVVANAARISSAALDVALAGGIERSAMEGADLQ